MALLNYRSTLLGEIGLSPAQILMGRWLKLLRPQETRETKHHLRKKKEREKFVYYEKQCSKELPRLEKGHKMSPKHDKKWIQATVDDKQFKASHAEVVHCSDAWSSEFIGEIVDAWARAEYHKH